MKRTVLIVEDNDANRLLLRDLLTYHGYRVVEAVDGEEGLRLAREENPDLILMDIQMPRMDGYAVGKALKECYETKCIRIIAVTSLAMRGDREKILAAGFDGYVTKPIDTRELARLLREMLKEQE